MMTNAFIAEHYELKTISSTRWRFEPIAWKKPTPTHRYFMLFDAVTRSFILSRQKVEEPLVVADEEQVAEFRKMLGDDEIAACMRKAMATPPPEDDNIPF